MKSLGYQIKSLRQERGLSQKDLADLLGLGQTTIANYEADLRQPNLDKLKQIADYFYVSLDTLLGRDISTARNGSGNTDEHSTNVTREDLMEFSKHYVEWLLSHQKDRAVKFIMSLYDDGVPVEDIYEWLFTPAMHETGRMWEDGIINSGEEHYISEITLSLISHLSMTGKGKRQSGHKALVTGISGEKHTIAAKIIADCFERSGIETYYLGGGVPLRSLIDNLISTQTDLLVMSVTMKEHLSRVKKLIADLRSHPKLGNIKILVGGQAFENGLDEWKQVGADAWARTYEEAVKRALELLEVGEKVHDNE